MTLNGTSLQTSLGYESWSPRFCPSLGCGISSQIFIGSVIKNHISGKDHFVDESRGCLKICASGLRKGSYRLQVLFLYPVYIFGNAQALT